jgi:hypothetical protein
MRRRERGEGKRKVFLEGSGQNVECENIGDRIHRIKNTKVQKHRMVKNL